ncbi:hypothetical protein P4S63_23590 [Pseudoalteromonas sp. B193]
MALGNVLTDILLHSFLMGINRWEYLLYLTAYFGDRVFTLPVFLLKIKTRNSRKTRT